MNEHVFDSEQYLDLEARRLQANIEYFRLPNDNSIGMIARPIPHTNHSDLVSVYGYSDQIGKAGNTLHSCDAEDILRQLARDARQRGLVSGYIRLGLAEGLIFPSSNQVDFVSLRTKVGEVVAVDLSKDPVTLVSEYRKNLRYDVRKTNQLVIERSDDFAAFHKIYCENMARVAAAEHYFFEERYLSSLGRIQGVELWLAFNGKTVVAGGIFVQQGENTFYHLGATANQALGQSPLKKLLHRRIIDLAKTGPRNLILGGGLGGADDALMRFKRGFSQLTLPVYDLRMIFDTEVYAQLTDQTEIVLNESDFFPAYR